MTIAPIRFHSSRENPSGPLAGDATALATGAHGGLRLRCESIERRLKPFLADDVLREAERHAEARAREPHVPVHALRQIPGDQRARAAPRG